MLQDTRITLFLLAELVATRRANDPDLFKRWLYGGIQDLGEPAVTELVLFFVQTSANPADQGHHCLDPLAVHGQCWHLCSPPIRIFKFLPPLAIFTPVAGCWPSINFLRKPLYCLALPPRLHLTLSLLSLRCIRAAQEIIKDQRMRAYVEFLEP